MKRASILNIGTELLVGHTLNTHANYLSKELHNYGFSVYQHLSVGDNMARIKAALKYLSDNSDFIVTTGGLGPTEDDITRQALAEFLELELVEDEKTRKDIDEFFKSLGKKASQNNYLQTYFPKGAAIIRNDRGTAPGFIVEKDGITYAALPGPPRELYGMMPKFLEKLTKGENRLYSRFISICGIGESDCAELIDDIFQAQTDPSMGIYVADGIIKLRLSTMKESEDEADMVFKAPTEALKSRIGDYIYSIEGLSLEEALVKLLKEKGLKIAVAESVTGGFLAKLITDVPGASEVFEYGLTCYSNAAKEKLLGVDGTVLAEKGAVSEEVACLMNEGLRKLSSADVLISSTGYAGPYAEDGSQGLIYAGFGTENKNYVLKYQLWGERAYIRRNAANRALFEAIKLIEAEF